MRLLSRTKQLLLKLWLKLLSGWLWFKTWEPRLSKIAIVGISILLVWTGIILGQHWAITTFDTYNHHLEQLAIDRGSLMTEVKQKGEKIADMEAQVGLLQGKGRRR